MSAASAIGTPQALCITSDVALRKTLRRTVKASGSSVLFLDVLPDGRPEAAIVFIDQPCRAAAGLSPLLQIVGQGSQLVILGESLENQEVVELLRNSAVNHLITDSHQPDEVELVVTAVKLLKGDIFGLEKYLAWGAEVHELVVTSYEDKRAALQAVAYCAEQVGARRVGIGKIEIVTDELLMNALYDAPAVRNGFLPSGTGTKGLRPHAGHKPALLRYACDGRYFGVSVEDHFGELRKEAILDHLVRARAARGAPKLGPRGGASGAGLGLYFVLSSVTRFIANIERSRRTEVICLFDLRQSGREASGCAQSLHIFTKQPDGGH